MKNIEDTMDKELWVLPYNNLIEILEKDAMKKIEDMTQAELGVVFGETVEERKKKCDITKLTEQTDEENHECIRLNILQNVVIDKSQEMMIEEEHPDLYYEMKSRGITIKDIENLLCAPKMINAELIDYIPSIEEIIEYMYSMVTEKKRRKAG